MNFFLFLILFTTPLLSEVKMKTRCILIYKFHSSYSLFYHQHSIIYSLVTVRPTCSNYTRCLFGVRFVQRCTNNSHKMCVDSLGNSLVSSSIYISFYFFLNEDDSDYYDDQVYIKTVFVCVAYFNVKTNRIH